ncbi:MAG: CDP-6-deoxy-delta-3,4-glucoseen reductase [Pseudomonadota bacterium]
MSFQVIIKPSNHLLTVQTDETILEAALREGYGLSYGCRDGACGTCKNKVLDGRVDYGNYQKSALTDAEKEQGLALFCQARPLTDLVIECREVGAIKDIQVKKLPCRVQKMEKLAPDVMVLYLKLPATEKFRFLAGQYVNILLKEGRYRSFSLANAPHDSEFLQLHVRRIPGGDFTEHVFAGMKERDILRIEGPLGTFFMREDSDKPIVLVASGTGFAPVKGMLEHAFASGIARPIVLYWGARKRADLYMGALPEQWQREHVNFRFVPVLSEPLASDGWQGRTGLVHQAVLDDYVDLSGCQVYACGTPVMVEAAHRDFTALRGLPQEEFFSDAFVFSGNPTPP